MNGRFEFRIFGNDLEAIHKVVAQRLKLEGCSQRTDVYLSDGDLTKALKLRAGEALELKCRVGDVDSFQHWRLHASVDLPASGPFLRDKFTKEITLPDLTGQTYSGTELHRVFLESGCSAFSVYKQRTNYAWKACSVEFTRVSIPLEPDQSSIAIEGTDLPQLEKLRGELGIENHQNLSYPDWLESLSA